MFPRRKRGFGFFDFDDDFGHMHEMMEKMLDDVVKRKEKGSEQSDEREPLIDIMNRKEDITVIAEVPGAEKHDIKTSLNSERDILYINVASPQRKYRKAVKLPERVRSEGASATCKNGVLEIKLRKEKPGKEEKGQEIKVD
ncbi:MAG: Hsp20/alpha crystallin family protein [Candidatus Burarchaeum sp.]|nr:Hsp20/alpha crystallin family protein [Candidatus Burarchaeum sp.]MDO8339599.1 Hsp20/alpha crystallin family protein [Candidatus Burarchaeum sp.]